MAVAANGPQADRSLAPRKPGARDERIRQLPYQIWEEEEGRPDGQETRHWEEASRQFSSEEESRDSFVETEGSTGALGGYKDSRVPKTAGTSPSKHRRGRVGPIQK
ncbi:DUF2934 domain-containing protein [Ensifer sp. Root1252]|uniref:DUF2934 domain-containing protein n=1 Tax=unclassified Ensifer TaxID=2633371 RepID=UPI003241BC89